jgi:hypothetical protein
VVAATGLHHLTTHGATLFRATLRAAYRIHQLCSATTLHATSRASLRHRVQCPAEGSSKSGVSFASLPLPFQQQAPQPASTKACSSRRHCACGEAVYPHDIRRTLWELVRTILLLLCHATSCAECFAKILAPMPDRLESSRDMALPLHLRIPG